MEYLIQNAEINSGDDCSIWYKRNESIVENWMSEF